MAMNGKALAAEMLAKLGGKKTKERKRAFEDLCEAIVQHIQKNAVVTGPVVGGGGGSVVAGKVT
jgi:hypothetical protein